MKPVIITQWEPGIVTGCTHMSWTRHSLRGRQRTSAAPTLKLWHWTVRKERMDYLTFNLIASLRRKLHPFPSHFFILELVITCWKLKATISSCSQGLVNDLSVTQQGHQDSVESLLAGTKAIFIIVAPHQSHFFWLVAAQLNLSFAARTLTRDASFVVHQQLRPLADTVCPPRCSCTRRVYVN